MNGILLVILDGMGDRQQPELGGQTPLDAARTPNLDSLAATGSTGLMWPCGPGRAPTSPVAHFTLFGYDPDEYPGRGLLEALGEGYRVRPGEVVCRASFLRAEERESGLWVTERTDPREGEPTNTDVNLDGVFHGVSCRFVHTDAAQGLLFLQAEDGTPLSAHVTDADPLRADKQVRAVLPYAEARYPDAAARTAEALNAWMLASRALLAGRQLDMAVVKWAGAPATVPSFSARTGLRGITLARGVLYAGIGAAVGLDSPGGQDGDDLAEDLRRDLGTALECLGGEYDFVHVHSKWPDMAGHRKSPQRKREVAELLDAAFAPHMERLLADDIVVCVTADHQTPASGPLYHSGGAVPLLVCGGAAGRDGVGGFGERSCLDGSLGHILGGDLMPLLLDCAERSAFLGAERYTAEKCFGTPGADRIVALRSR